MNYDHAHPDADIFKEGSEWKPREITLADYIAKKHPYPCVVVGDISNDKDDQSPKV